ncbi:MULTISPECIES: PspC domain-containing protein [Fibrobacter]|uniref:Phage shock protein C (PspC) family protein n=1 Tax=Fibrobacter intestinalis TaxID=28122 RepID=A0A1M6VT45_9BACT|nr:MULTISPECIES: PspC domain-containing protein [Fibrobacter]MDD7299767.1 PspC domain-containing protein [Fibrobacter intestinalis]PBC67154.1 phage shock protein C (PspC) family protein [Fibrobacter sp. UWS1]PBC73350.1 phage shock protein C (PspC) family protein [Fibrobacter sp. NR9]SHK84485.1 phage shock protein C (PspC) family protein [Fibrobacter intestinalis]SKA02039.1 phage shock protein C (PspC) family protein [Fibrobacter intestinalis]
MKKLTLSENNKKIAGVCGGIGEYFNIDPTIVRILWIAGIFLSLGTGVLAYLLCWFLIPNPD